MVDDYCDRWPGTTLLMGQARVLEFRATAEIIDLIADFAGGLFDTGHDPALPQDFFMRSGTTTVLESISHEKLATTRVSTVSPLLKTLEDEGFLAGCR